MSLPPSSQLRAWNNGGKMSTVYRNYFSLFRIFVPSMQAFSFVGTTPLSGRKPTDPATLGGVGVSRTPSPDLKKNPVSMTPGNFFWICRSYPIEAYLAIISNWFRSHHRNTIFLLIAFLYFLFLRGKQFFVLFLSIGPQLPEDGK